MSGVDATNAEQCVDLDNDKSQKFIIDKSIITITLHKKILQKKFIIDQTIKIILHTICGIEL